MVNDTLWLAHSMIEFTKLFPPAEHESRLSWVREGIGIFKNQAVTTMDTNYGELALGHTDVHVFRGCKTAVMQKVIQNQLSLLPNFQLLPIPAHHNLHINFKYNLLEIKWAIIRPNAFGRTWDTTFQRRSIEICPTSFQKNLFHWNTKFLPPAQACA